VDVANEIIPQLFRLAVQQLVNDCEIHFNLTSVVVLTLSVDAQLESMISTVD